VWREEIKRGLQIYYVFLAIQEKKDYMVPRLSEDVSGHEKRKGSRNETPNRKGFLSCLLSVMFRIAIPTYKRADMLGKKTLTFLSEYGIDPSLIDIFVASEAEEKEYREKLRPGTYGNLIVGHLGIARQRTFIQQFYPLGQRVWSLDDDIRGVVCLRENLDLMDFVSGMFDLCEREGVTVWGVYPAGTKFYLKDEMKKGVLYIVACFYGYINKKDLIYPPLDTKEDWWSTLERCRIDGAVIRCHFIAPKTTYWLKTGGLAETRTLELERIHATTVAAMFPQYTEGMYVRRNGHPDVKLKRLPSTKI
jgi:hypothetical protein